MERTFARRLKTESAFRLWLEAIAQTAVTAPKEHLHILSGDIRYSARTLTKVPGFFLAAMLAIALGISATTVVFSLIHAVLIRPLPYGHAEQLVYIWTPLASVAGIPREFSPYCSDVRAWQEGSRLFQDITSVRRFEALVQDGMSVRVGAAKVPGNFFRTMDVNPEFGRTIDENDAREGSQFVAVISDRLWRSKFGADPRAIGTTMHIAGHTYRMIGVMPMEFSYPHGNDVPSQDEYAWMSRTDIWIPLVFTPKQLADPDLEEFHAVIGRIRPGISLAQAQAELSTIEKPRERMHPEGLMKVLTVSFVETVVGPARPLLRLLTGAVALVLLMACGNFAGLLMARGAGRTHEIGVRTALGAERTRLVRLVMTESLMLSVGGGVLAVPFSYVALKVLTRLNPGNIPRFEEAALDLGVLLFGLVVSFVAGLISGIVPAVSTAASGIEPLLRQGARGIAGVSRNSRSLLIVAEIALSIVLLAGSGLLIRSYLKVQGEDKGFSTSTLTLNVVMDREMENQDAPRRELMRRIQALPGVEAAGSIDDLPLSTSQDKGFIEIEGRVSRGDYATSVRGTGGEYFRAMGIRLLSGRYLEDRDIGSSSGRDLSRPVIVSRSFAARYFPRGDVLGHRLRMNNASWSTIVGVVGDVRHSGLEAALEPIVYWQNGLVDSVAIRTTRPPESIVPAIRRTAREVDAGFSITDVQTMDAYVHEATAPRRFQTVVLASFAGLAVILALSGLYALLAYAVRQRAAEIGVRMAIGATPGDVVRMVVLHGLKLAGAGLAIGLCLALALTRLLASFLYGVRAADPVTFLVIPVFVIAVSAGACAIPAWRAARIDPVRALRGD